MSTALTQAAPFVKAAAVTKSDSTVLPPTRGIYVGGAGDVALLLADDASPVTFVGVQAGAVLYARATKVMSTGTSATSIVALW